MQDGSGGEGRIVAHAPANLEAVHIGQIDVQYDDGRKVPLHRSKGGSRVRRGEHLIAGRKNGLPKLIEHYLVIIDQQYFYGFLG